MFRQKSSEHRDDENRYLNYFQQVQIDKGFYFSYTYDLTRSLQENIMRKMRKREQRDKGMEFTMTDKDG